MSKTEKKDGKFEGRVCYSKWTSKYIFSVSNANILGFVSVCRKLDSVPKEKNLSHQLQANHQRLAEPDVNEKNMTAETSMTNLQYK